MRSIAILAPLLLVLSGCAATPDPGPGAAGRPDDVPPGTFAVPWMHVGDQLTYDFTFAQGTGPSFSGTTTFSVIGPTTINDGYGTSRAAIHLRQSNPDGSFAEDYFVDAKSFRQLKLERRDTYNETATLEAPPPAPLPTKRSYANATGNLERYAYDPFFEDANMFGVFATGRAVPDNGTFEIFGNLWQRNGTTRLMGGASEGNISIPAASEQWGELRTLDFTVAHNRGETYFETIEWNGDFAANVPFAVRAERKITANFFGDEIDVTFLLTLTGFTPGKGELLTRQDGAAAPGGPVGDRAAAPRFPADGNGDKLAFPLSEMVAALEKDPTAIQYFQNHPGSYLYFAELYDVNTCEFYPNGPEPAGCHWLQWFGVFFAPDDWILTFWTEKYANADGTGAAYPPVLARETIFETLFTAAGGDPAFEPTPAIVAENSGMDLSERSAYPEDSLTVAGAIELWKTGSSDANEGQPVNSFWVHLTATGYEFQVEHQQWEFPPENPEFFPMYDNMPFELLRHGAIIKPDGFAVEQRNYEVVIEHR